MPTSHFSRQGQRLALVTAVLLLHGLLLWSLQSGLLQRALVLAQEVVVPVSVITELPRPPKATPAPLQSKPAQSLTPLSPTQPAPAPRVASLAASPPLAESVAAANAPTVAGPAPSAPAAAPAAPVAAAATATAAAPKLELPSSSADYLHNPKPLYPKLSERRGEQGTVILHALIGVDGRVRELAVKTSSGYERLDQAAREAVLEWTFVPGKRNGVAVEMAVDVPIRFKPSE
jgi:protein TonB